MPVAMRRDRIPRGHTQVKTTCSRGTSCTSAVLVVGGSSECGLLLNSPASRSANWARHKKIEVKLPGCGFEAAPCPEPLPCEGGAARRVAEIFLKALRRFVSMACVDSGHVQFWPSAGVPAPSAAVSSVCELGWQPGTKAQCL